MTAEEWRPVPDYEDLYEVSSLGRIRSFDRMVARQNGHLIPWKGRILKLNKGSKGHYRVNLFRDGKPKMVYIHQIVAKVFISNPESLPLVRHWNDDKTDNTVSNLLWGTHSDNRQDAIRNGVQFGSFHKSKTHCANGHPYSGDNLYVNPNTGARACRACSRAWYHRNYKPKNKENN